MIKTELRFLLMLTADNGETHVEDFIKLYDEFDGIGAGESATGRRVDLPLLNEEGNV